MIEKILKLLDEKSVREDREEVERVGEWNGREEVGGGGQESWIEEVEVGAEFAYDGRPTVMGEGRGIKVGRGGEDGGLSNGEGARAVGVMEAGVRGLGGAGVDGSFAQAVEGLRLISDLLG